MLVRFSRPVLAPLLIALALVIAAPADAQTLRYDPVTAEPTPGALSEAAAITGAPIEGATGGGLTLLGRLADGETRGLARAGNVLFRSNGGYLEALDVTNPVVPVVLDRFLVQGGIVQEVDIHESGVYAYVAVSRGVPYGNQGGLYVLNVFDPSNIQEVGRLTGRSFFDVWSDGGNVVHAAAGGGGLRVISVLNPAAPVEIGSLAVPGGSVLGIEVHGVMCLAAGNAGLRLVDASNPTAPTALGGLTLGGFATRVDVAGTFAYVAVQDVGLVVVNISDPAQPVEVGRYLVQGPSNFQIRSVALSDVSSNVVYLGKDDGILSLDVTNFADITVLDSLNFGVSGSSQYILEGSLGRLYVGNRYSGVRVLDATNPADLSEITLIENGGFSFKVNVIGGVAYVADLLGQLRLIDVSVPEAPVELGRLAGLRNANGVDVEGTTAYVVHRGTFVPPTGMVTRVNISNPASPTLIDQQTTPWWAYGVDVVGSNVFVATGNNGTTDGSVRAYQDAGPLNLLDEGATGNQAFDVRVAAGRAYVPTFGSGLSILDVTNPADIQPLSLNSIGAFSTSVEVNGTVVYMSDNDIGGSRGLSVIDVSNPASPQLLDTGTAIAGGSPTDVAYGADHAFVSVDFVGLYPFDVTNPADVVGLPSITTADRATGVDAEGTLVAVADAGAGIWLFRIEPPTASEPGAPAGLRVVDAGPNPFRGEARLRFELPHSSDVVVEVFSTLGRRVARLDLGTQAAGAHEVALDGRAWPAGAYLYRLSAGGEVATGRLTLVR